MAITSKWAIIDQDGRLIRWELWDHADVRGVREVEPEMGLIAARREIALRRRLDMLAACDYWLSEDAIPFGTFNVAKTIVQILAEQGAL